MLDVETGDILLVQLSMVETYFFHITKSMQQNSALQSISIFTIHEILQ